MTGRPKKPSLPHQLLLWPALLALLCSCATTTVKQTWKAPGLNQPVGKIAVITVDERGMLRKAFENRFVKQLIAAGTPAMVTYSQFTLEELKKDKRAAAESFQTNSAQAVLILRLVDLGIRQREIQPGGERYSPVITGFEYTGWYDYYTVGFMNMSPTYSSETQEVVLESSIHELTTGKRIWAGVTKTVLKEDMDRLAEMDPLVGKIILAMKKDRVIK